ncbi:MAG: Glu/Leu/Phe/Val dehydrogenase dimerization domain-containing protein [Pseudomonadota bacterium]
MELFDHPDFDGHEQVVFAHDSNSGLRAIIAVHDTRLGPALGGCRIWRYSSDGEALTDVLRLSRGMSYKAALADLPLGGGKSVMLVTGDRPKTPAMMQALGSAIDRLGGRYIAAEDVGATVADMDQVATRTGHVSGNSGGVGDPSPWTARGVFLSIEAAARHRLGRGVGDLSVSVSGLGSVGGQLCRMLAEAGARLVVSDVRAEAVAAVVAATGAGREAPEAAHRAAVDVFAPCALGAVLNSRTIPEISAKIVCGAANNQLSASSDDALLADREILYAPDYLVNVGGLISVSRPPTGIGDAAAKAKLEAIPATLLSVFEKADAESIAPGAAADALARGRLGM